MRTTDPLALAGISKKLEGPLLISRVALGIIAASPSMTAAHRAEFFRPQVVLRGEFRTTRLSAEVSGPLKRSEPWTDDMQVSHSTAGRVLTVAALALVLGQAARALLLSPQGPGRINDLLFAVPLALLLIVLTLRARPPTWAGSHVIGASVGLLFFTCMLGIDRVDPTSVAWLMFGDWAQHYLGWEMFRHEGLNIPPGRITGLWSPVGTSIVFTDSLPLLALPLSLVSDWLPPQFQYIGAFMAASFILQGALAARLAQNAGLHAAGQMLVALLFVNAPFLIARLGHDTLTAHWTLLACLMLATSVSAPRAVASWYALVALSTLIHPYLAAMCGPLAGTALWWQLRESPRRVVVAHGIAGALLALALL